MNADAVPQSTSRSLRRTVEFGPFRYDPLHRQVYAPEGPLRIGSRAIGLLDVLLEVPGRLYSREELVSRVWQGIVVAETSLRVHMSELRRQLGDRHEQTPYITNVPGRGYVFTAPVRLPSGHQTPGERNRRSLRIPLPLPVNLGAPIGREAAIACISDMLGHARLVSLVGPAGVGKTTVVEAALASLSSRFEDGIALADFSLISQSTDVEFALGHALGLRWLGPSGLEEALRDRHLLIVLDHCEHLVDAVAELVDRLLQTCAGLCFIFSGCEPLRVREEWVYRLQPLAVPEERAACGLEELLSYPAIRLFEERARARCASFTVSEHNAATVARLCRLLGGVPLALELAAARVAEVGLPTLAASCESSLALLDRGRRTACPRHRSLRALLSWSCSGLSGGERDLLQRMSAFSGSFTLCDATALLCVPGRPEPHLVGDILNLYNKSILLSEGSRNTEPRYRLLHAMRVFAQELKAERGVGSIGVQDHTGDTLPCRRVLPV
ncbi:MAG TPA: winged helix-turn-helix domain-containing protein [Burkholderiaceae bacterium]|jgi:predicted ATPase/DNA-binding winged helix-turn-helix (wHTH) protein